MNYITKLEKLEEFHYSFELLEKINKSWKETPEDKKDEGGCTIEEIIGKDKEIQGEMNKKEEDLLLKQ